MLPELIKIGGYAMILKEFADRYALTRKNSRIARRADNARILMLGAGIGTLAGAAAGLLFAPQSGSEMRRQIAERTGETITNIKERVSNTTERVSARVQERSSSAREAAEICSQAIRDAMSEPETGGGSKRKKR